MLSLNFCQKKVKTPFSTPFPFSNLNEIIHPNAESIPEYIHHFASAMFVNESFWNNQTSITDELEREGNLDDHIDSYLSHTYMLKKTHDSRLSLKHMFRIKLQWQISDFSNNFDMLRFHFDRSLYKTVSGIVTLVNVITRYTTFQQVAGNGTIYF